MKVRINESIFIINERINIIREKVELNLGVVGNRACGGLKCDKCILKKNSNCVFSIKFAISESGLSWRYMIDKCLSHKISKHNES